MTLPPQTPTGRLRALGAKKTRLAELKPGRLFTVPLDEWPSWRTLASLVGRETGRRFATRRAGDVVEVWRVE